MLSFAGDAENIVGLRHPAVRRPPEGYCARPLRPEEEEDPRPAS